MDRMPSLRINMNVTPEAAKHIVAILLNMPGVPTSFSFDGRAEGTVTLWLSKRGYDYLKRHLAELKEQELI